MERTILVVEDETGIADNISYALRTEGYGVQCCCTGMEARAVLEGGEIDLIVLDVGLPDVNGFDLCTEIRKKSDVPIIFLTARSDEVDRIVGLEIGGDDYLAKPFSPRELSARVKAVLRRSRRAEPGGATAVKTPFEIDGKRFVISYFGELLELSRYEFRILETLIGRPGWVFSRDQLMEAAWDEPDASVDRTVDTHIKNIRAKLRVLKPDDNPIRTHRGIGYSLKESW